MELHPTFKFRPRLFGEAAVYDLLQAIDEPDGFAVHSVNLPEHEYKRWGEADFVVVSQSGLVLLEVKGGTVSLAGRVWRYENARGQAIVSSEGPARQAISAAVALEQMLQKRMGRKIRCRWGVVFPHCTFVRSLDELPSERLAERQACRNPNSFHAWLDKIPFDQHSAKEFELSDAEILQIKEILLPEMSAASSLGLSVFGVQRGVIKLTRQQYGILESLAANPRITVTGGAGTGKTELAVLCALAESDAGRRPAVLVQGPALLNSLRDRLSGTGIPVTDGRIPLGTDVLIVDEGQDYMQPALLTSVFEQLPGGIEHGRWRWFMDPNLQYLHAAPDRQSMDRIRAASVSVSLSRNVRSTLEIVRSIQAFLGADIGLSSIDGYGVRVGFHEVGALGDEAAAVGALVRSMLEAGVRAAEIAVLGPQGREGPTGGAVERMLGDLLRAPRPDGRFASPVHGVIGSVVDFRGLESRVVILVDMAVAAEEVDFERNLYVGMTRASAVLHIFVPETVKRRMAALLAQN
jgi:hypothetical protein